MKAGGWIGGEYGPRFSICDRAGAISAAQYVRMSTEQEQYSPENQLEVIQYAAAP